MLNVYCRPLLLTVVCLALTSLVWGQGISTGTIIGVVVDDQDAVVVSAKIVAVQSKTNVSVNAVSNSAGEFKILGLPVGSYQVTISATGFEDKIIEDVIVNAGTQTTLGRASLSVAGATQNLQVQSSTPLLQTDTMNIGIAFETKTLTQMPVGNGFDVLALYVPGIATTGDVSFGNSNGAAFGANGQRGRDNDYQIDGQGNNDTNIGGPIVLFGNQDALEEIQILTNYSAEYGRGTGTVVNYITKQGTNEFHGNGYEFYNGDWADSLPNQDKSILFQNCPSGVAAGTVTASAPLGCRAPHEPHYVDNRFGGTIGGPIVKNKLWFFSSSNIELTRAGETFSSGGLVTPDAAGLAALNADFPGNAGVAALNAIGPLKAPGKISFGPPQIDTVDGLPIEVAPYTRQLPANANDYEATGRADWQVDDRDRVFVRYIFQQSLSRNVGAGGDAVAGDFVDVSSRDQDVGVDFTHTFSSSFLNQVRYSYGRLNLSFQGGAFPNCTEANYGDCPVNVFFGDNSESFGVSPAIPNGRFILDHQIQDNASFLHGKHFFKWGGEYNHQSQPNFFLPFINGFFIYGGFSSLVDNNAPGGTPGLCGAACTSDSALVFLTDGPPQINFKENQFAFYFQDDWKPFDNFTFSLGLRYDLYGQALNTVHDVTVARETNPATAFWDPSLPLNERTVPSLPINWKNFSPVIGFAYSPKSGFLGRNSTVIRGGYRISYSPAFYNIFVNAAGEAPAVDAGQNFCDNCLPAAGTGSAAQAGDQFLVPKGVSPGFAAGAALPARFLSPYTEQWQFGIQHEFGPSVVAEVRYIGNHAIHQFQNVNGNPALGALASAGFSSFIPSGITPCSDPSMPGGFAGYANCANTLVYEVTNSGFSFYNGLQMRVDTRNWHGLTTGFNYTYSKSTDNTSEIFATGFGGNTQNFSQNPFNNNERALSALDYPNTISLYTIYAPPFFSGRHDWVGKTLSGWSISPVYRFNSGQLYSVVQNHPGSWATSLCDPTQYSSQDFCRPILSNPTAPFGSVGICTDPSAPDCGVVMYNPHDSSLGTGAGIPGGAAVPTTLQNVHWLFNDVNGAKFVGTPYGGAARNIARGPAIDTINLSVVKLVKLNERYNMELHFTAYNLLNHMYLGTPDPNVSHGTFNPATLTGSFGNNFFNPSGGGGNQVNSVFQGLAQRRLEVGAKIVF